MADNTQMQMPAAEVAAVQAATMEAGVPPGKCFSQGNPVFSCSMDVEPLAPAEQTGEGADWFEGYNQKPTNPMYRTSNSSYGHKKPTVHTMPVQFYAKSQKFSEHLGTCGMFRNHSLNCATDKTIVPDH